MRLQQRDRALAAAPKALALIGTPTDARILDAIWVDEALVVVSEQPTAHLAYAVDSFRPPTADETDPDQTDPRAPGDWILLDQYGNSGADAVPGMVASATAYLRELADQSQSAA